MALGIGSIAHRRIRNSSDCVTGSGANLIYAVDHRIHHYQDGSDVGK